MSTHGIGQVIVRSHDDGEIVTETPTDGLANKFRRIVDSAQRFVEHDVAGDLQCGHADQPGVGKRRSQFRHLHRCCPTDCSYQRDTQTHAPPYAAVTAETMSVGEEILAEFDAAPFPRNRSDVAHGARAVDDVVR